MTVASVSKSGEETCSLKELSFMERLEISERMELSKIAGIAKNTL